jgi:hypothetical protein
MLPCSEFLIDYSTNGLITLSFWYYTLGMVNPRSCVFFMARWGIPNGATLDILMTSVMNATVNGKL